MPMDPPDISFHLSDEEIMVLSAFQSAHFLEIACFTLMLYDLLITIGQEVEYFWSGPWNISRVLFFLNRYLPFFVIAPHIALFGVQVPAQSCTQWIRATLVFSIVAICINQGILLLRVWYMYSHSAVARAVACFSYAACTISSLLLMGLNLPSLKSSTELLQIQRQMANIQGCSARASWMIWIVFLPSTIIHTILFVFTIARVVNLSHQSWMKQLMGRLIRDGGLVFFVSMASAIFAAIGARFFAVPVINGPATWSNSQLAISAAVVSRLMLSIRSLAGKLRDSQNLHDFKLEGQTRIN